MKALRACFRFLPISPMNRFLAAFRALVLGAAASVCMIAAAQVPAPPEIAARSYLLLDVTANQILAQKDIDSPVEPCSIR